MRPTESQNKVDEKLVICQATLEAVEEGLLTVDYHGKIVNYNRKFIELWHIPPEMIRMRATERETLAFIAEHLVGPADFFNAIGEGHKEPAKQTTGTIKTVDGKHVTFYAEEQIRDGRSIGRVWSFRDVTERIVADAQIHSLINDLERSNSDLEYFAYIASHDLQEPLRAVTGSVQLLARRYKGRLDPEADEFIEFAVDGARRMKVLITDLLVYSRVSTRGKPFAAVDCEKVLDEALKNISIALSETGARVTRDALPTVWGDAGQLALLFQNLVGNAVKFRRDQTPLIHISATRQGGATNTWVFTVSDNGIGIDMKYADRIFTIFQRLHTIAEFPGTGMGLALCKKIVDRHGGRIWVESVPGEGATFMFTLPEAPA